MVKTSAWSQFSSYLSSRQHLTGLITFPLTVFLTLGTSLPLLFKSPLLCAPFSGPCYTSPTSTLTYPRLSLKSLLSPNPFSLFQIHTPTPLLRISSLMSNKHHKSPNVQWLQSSNLMSSNLTNSPSSFLYPTLLPLSLPFFLSSFLRSNSYIVQLSHLKYPIQWILIYL